MHRFRRTAFAGFWYDQDEHEWIVLLAGSATLQWEDGSRTDLAKETRDHSGHQRYRVAMTSRPGHSYVLWKRLLEEVHGFWS